MRIPRHVLRFGWCGAATLACGTELVQTATLPKPAVIDCSAPVGTVLDPSVEQFGELDRVIDSPLLSTRYGLDAGPGILVFSRDAFRLFVNGELLAESSQPMQAQFVGYSFLPGKNVISVLASGAGRAPLVSVRVDELDRSYGSGADWKISRKPGTGWTGIDFDDSTWDHAQDFGVPDPTSSCGRLLTPFAASGAHIVGDAAGVASSIAIRYSFVIGPVGFGAATTGGSRGPAVVVNDLTTFRNAVSDDTERVVLFDEGLFDFRATGADVSTVQTCPRVCATSEVTQYVAISRDDPCDGVPEAKTRNERQVKIRSNKTIVGLGRGAQLRGLNLDLTDSVNVVLRNLAIFDVNPTLIEAGDGVTLNRSSRIWLDHCTFKSISDGFVDLIASNAETTLSWLKLDGQNAAACRGRHLRASEVVGSDATYHHCLWQHVDGRAPLAHGALTRVHLYNNAVIDAADYAVGSGCQAQVLVEGSYFEAVSVATSRRDCTETPGQVGLIRSPAGSNRYDATSNRHHSFDDVVSEPMDTVFSPPYLYSVDEADVIRVLVPTRAGAGSHWAIPLPE